MKTYTRLLRLTASLLIILASLSSALAQTRSPKPTAAADSNLTYLRDVRPIFMGKCARCHNENSILGNWLDYRTAFGDRREIKRRVWDSWQGHYYKQPMPAGNSPESGALSEQERAIIREWVDAGAALGVVPPQNAPASKPERIEQGKRLFAVVCTPCHQANGQGIAGKFPPLAQSDFLNADKNRAIQVLLHGRQGQITVNGQQFNNSMPQLPFSDEDIASALTFVYNSFGNSAKDVTPAEVKALRAQPADEGATGFKELVHAGAEPSPFE